MSVADVTPHQGDGSDGREVLGVSANALSLPAASAPADPSTAPGGAPSPAYDPERPRLQDRIASIDPWDDYTASDKARWYAFEWWRTVGVADVVVAVALCAAIGWAYFAGRWAADALSAGETWPQLVISAPLLLVVWYLGRRHSSR